MIFRIRSPLVVFLLLLCLALNASDDVNIDSLLSVWDSHDLPITERLDAMHQMVEYKCGYRQTDDCESLIDTFKTTIIKHEQWQYDPYVEYYLAGVSMWKNPYDITEQLVSDLIICTEDTKNRELRADILNMMANLHFYKGEHLKAVEINWSIVEIFDKMGKEHVKGITYYNMAWSYMKLGKLIEAYDVLILCGAIADKYEDEYLENFHLAGMVRLYTTINDVEKALEYLHKREKVVQKEGYEKPIIEVYLGIAETGKQNNESYEFVYEYLQKAKALSKEIGWKLTEIKADYQYSVLLISRDSIDKAERILTSAFQLAKEMATEDDLQKIKKELAEIHFKNKKYYEVVRLLDRDFQTRGGHETVLSGYGILAESYFSLGNLDSAYYYQKKMGTYQDSLMNKNKLKELLRMELSEKYAFEKKELQNKHLTQENKLLKHEGQRKNLIFSLIFLGLLAAFSLVSAFWFRKKNAEVKLLNYKLENTNHLLKESNKNLESYARVVSHDIKSPIRLTNSYLQLVKQYLDSGNRDKVDTYMNYIFRTMKTLDNMIDNILLLSRLDNHKDLRVQSIDIEEVINNAIQNLTLEIHNSKAKIQVRKKGELKSYLANEVHMIQVIQNILSNAIKFRKKDAHPEIDVVCFVKQQRIHISIKDNGRGIKKNEQNLIYQQFKRLSSSRGVQGSGLGMAITKKIIDKYHGEIDIDSEVDVGTTVSISFPILRENDTNQNSRIVHETAI